MKKFIFISLFFLFFHLFANAENFNVFGKLLEKGTKKPITNASFFIKETKQEIITDDFGNFKIKLLPGKYTVLIFVSGYEKLEQKIVVNKNEKLKIIFRIMPLNFNPYAITVKGKKKKNEVSFQRITTEEAVAIPGTNRDVVQAVTNLPGVNSISVFNGYGSGLVVRGSAPEDSLIKVDDHSIPLLYHFGGLESVLEPEMVSSTDFYAGGFSPQYFNATGGVIQINLRNPRSDRWGGYANFSLLSASTMIEGPLGKKDSISFSFKRGMLDAYVAIMDKAGVFNDKVNFETYPFYYDGSVVFAHKFSATNFIKTIIIGSFDKMKIHKKTVSDNQKIGTSISNTSEFIEMINEWHFKKGKFYSLFSPMIQAVYLDADLGSNAYLKNGFYNLSLSEKFLYKLSKHQKIKLGLKLFSGFYTLKANLFAMKKEGEISYNPFNEKNQIEDNSKNFFWYPGFYLIDEIKLNKFIFSPGFNFIYDTHNKKYLIDPRGFLKFNITKKWALKTAVGLYSQIPSNDENFKPWGTPGLEPEKAIHIVGGVEFSPMKNIYFDLQGYYKKLFDLVVRIDRNDPTVYANKGKGYVYGVEFLARHKLAHNFFGWISYSWSVSRRKDFLGTSGNEAKWRPFDMDINHNLKIIASYKINNYWQIGAKFTLLSGLPYSDLQNCDYIYDSDNNISIPVYKKDINSDRMPIQHQLDIRIDKYWIFNTWILSTYLDFQNIYMHKNAIGVSYSKDFSQKEYQNNIPIMIFLGLKANF